MFTYPQVQVLAALAAKPTAVWLADRIDGNFQCQVIADIFLQVDESVLRDDLFIFRKGIIRIREDLLKMGVQGGFKGLQTAATGERKSGREITLQAQTLLGAVKGSRTLKIAEDKFRG